MDSDQNNGDAIRLGLIVACSENDVIGVDGDLPWHLPEDLKHFMRSTKGHAVVMGRKTFESLDKPLPGRLNIVVSRSMSIEDEIPGLVMVVRSLAEGIEAGKAADRELGKGLVWIAGGGEIYKQAIDGADLIVRTLVHCELTGDTHFPEICPDNWGRADAEEYPADDRHSYGFTIEQWVKKECGSD
jgi:dihydrofolate reductase